MLERWRERDVFHESMRRREGSPPLRLLRGPAHGQRPARVAPRPVARLQGRLPALQDDARPLRPAQGRLGLPRPAGRARGREGARLHRRRHDIERYGVAEFNAKCRESVLRYIDEWNALTERIGFWIDTDDAYFTLDNDYVESVWWSLKQVWDKGLLTEGHKVVPVLPALRHRALEPRGGARLPRTWSTRRCSCSFPLAGRPGVSLLAWTTMPWTLVPARRDRGRPRGHLRARPPRRRAADPGRGAGRAGAGRGGRGRGAHARLGAARPALRAALPVHLATTATKGHTVLAGDFVSIEDGTGVVHTGAAFGEDDFRLASENGLTIHNPVRPDGTFDERTGPFAGMYVREADAHDHRGAARVRAGCSAPGEYEHAYPHCWRCDTPLIYYAKTNWYVRTTAVQGRAAGRQRDDRLVPRAHQARALRQVAREQRGLGALARALLGHAAADLALRRGRRPRGLRRLARRDRASAAARRPTTCTGPTSTRSCCAASSAAARCAACPT